MGGFSNYPPGVTGNEWQITGLCPDCGGECEEGECPGPPEEYEPDIEPDQMDGYS
jgi:hypothetical protein